MFDSRKIKIDKALHARLAEIARIGGYSSTDELITNLLEKELARYEEAEDNEQVDKQLRGLGYLE
jgi:metal-responsive CopG/Arc/MetJ family transcriptional regulator